MSGLFRAFLMASLAAIVASCASPDNPYPGSGGSLFRDPTKSEVDDPQLVFNPDKLATLRIGASTKREIVALFGRPTWWETNENGFSRLEFDFHGKGGTVNTPYLVPETFIFDATNVLVDADYVDFDKTFHVERGPFKYAYFQGLVGSNALILDGIVPSDWIGEGKIPIGGYIRAPVQVHEVVAGDVPRRNLSLVFTVSGLRIAPWPAYFLISIDRFGTTYVIDWDREPRFCTIEDAEVQVPDIKPFILAIKSSPTCASETNASHTVAR